MLFSFPLSERFLKGFSELSLLSLHYLKKIIGLFSEYAMPATARKPIR
jgi:hypothetical protein